MKLSRYNFLRQYDDATIFFNDGSIETVKNEPAPEPTNGWYDE